MPALPALQVSGDFEAQDAVRLCDEDGVEIGRGLVNYSSHELDEVKVGRGGGQCC